MRAMMMTRIREPLAEKNIPDPQPVQGRFEFAFMQRGSVALTCTFGTGNFLFRYRLFLVTSLRE
jgi:hypothetical protein